jgi:endonuclease YncB( thermonuclease family)
MLHRILLPAFVLALLTAATASFAAPPVAAPAPAPVSVPAPVPAPAAASVVPVAPMGTAGEAGLPQYIKRPMRAVDPMTLRAEGMWIRLWGIKPAELSDTPLELQALDHMDQMIQEGEVNCLVQRGSRMPEIIGVCRTQSGQDIAIELLQNGFVVVDRRQTYDSVYASAYEKAQEQARLAAVGVWSFMNGKQAAGGSMSSGLPGGSFLTIALIVGPFGGMLLVALIMWYWLKRMASAQEAEAEQSSRKEQMLVTRERQVLVSTLEGELSENKNKIEAFLVIYGDLLRSLKDPNEVPKYQQGGDIVQKHPSFSKTVFEANVNKLSLLDMKLAGKISKLYSALPKDQEYINLEPGVPLDTAVQLVEKVLKEAENMLTPINAIIGGLQGNPAPKPSAPAADKAEKAA